MFIEELSNEQYEELGKILIGIEAKLNNVEVSEIIDVGGEICINQPWVVRIYGLYQTKNGKAVFVDFNVEDFFCTIFYPADQKCLVEEPETTKAIRKYFAKLFKKEYKAELKRELAELGDEV